MHYVISYLVFVDSDKQPRFSTLPIHNEYASKQRLVVSEQMYLLLTVCHIVLHQMTKPLSWNRVHFINPKWIVHERRQ